MREKLVVVCICAAIAGGMRCFSALPGSATPAPAPAAARAPSPGRPSTSKFMMPVLTVSEVSGGAYHRLPFTFERTGRDEPLKVLIAEDIPSGSGKSIRSSVWLAAVTAAMRRSDPMNGVRITVEFSGDVDGPSAGGVMCLSILSAMAGRTIPDDFAMTGTIMPDGTIGAVGGVALKMRAAIKRGCKRICIPMFCRFERQKDGTLVDLFRIGEKEHVVVKPVKNIGEAYAFLHGLPPPPLPVVDEFAVRSLPRDVEDCLIKRCKDAEIRIEKAKRDNKSFAKLLEENEFFKDFLFRDDYVREYKTGRILSAHSSVSSLESCWATVPTWLKSCEGMIREFPVLSKSAPFSQRDRRDYLAAVKKLQKRFMNSVEAFLEGTKVTSGDDQGSGFVRDADFLSEIAAQDEDVIETSALAAGMLVHLALTAENGDKEDSDKLSDEEVDGLLEIEGRKEFFRLFLKYVLGSDGDVDMRKATYRHYGNVSPNADLESVERLFHSAWRASDATLNSDIVNQFAEHAEATSDNVRKFLAIKDLHFAGYMFSKTRVELAHGLLDKPEKLEDRRYHAAALLSINARMLASSCVLLVKYGSDIEGSISDDDDYTCGAPEVLNYLIRRARESALLSISDCARAGVPCLSALTKFEEADGKDLGSANSEDLLHDVLESYWSAGLQAKALLMAFSKKSALVQ